ERREQGRVLGRPRDVWLLLDGDGDEALVRRGGQRVGPRRLALALEVLQERRPGRQVRGLGRGDGAELPRPALPRPLTRDPVPGPRVPVSGVSPPPSATTASIGRTFRRGAGAGEGERSSSSSV